VLDLLFEEKRGGKGKKAAPSILIVMGERGERKKRGGNHAANVF